MEYESDEAMRANDRFEECVLIFKSELEMQEFKDYAREKWEERTDYLKGMIVPYMELPKASTPRDTFSRKKRSTGLSSEALISQVQR